MESEISSCSSRGNKSTDGAKNDSIAHLASIWTAGAWSAQAEGIARSGGLGQFDAVTL